jgi:UDP-GlcNAc3NAcA epimerase
VLITLVVGARPQFVKLAPVRQALLDTGFDVAVVHTGQHYDDEMSRVFFRDLAMPAPDENLGVGSGTHGSQTGRMLDLLERSFTQRRPDVLVVFGDTNSTLAGALAASKMGIAVAHVEAGLRSGRRSMAEEINRVVVDHLSQVLFCSSSAGAANLMAEGIRNGVYVVGDVMRDALEWLLRRELRGHERRRALVPSPDNYVLATIHRAETCADESALRRIMTALGQLARPVILPLHPRTAKAIAQLGMTGVWADNVRVLPPVGYSDIIALLQGAERLLTDSGGLQKEAYWLGVPCLTLRDETEWTETVTAGWNRLVGTNVARILSEAGKASPTLRPELYGDGRAANRIAATLRDTVGVGRVAPEKNA